MDLALQLAELARDVAHRIAEADQAAESDRGDADSLFQRAQSRLARLREQTVNSHGLRTPMKDRVSLLEQLAIEELLQDIDTLMPTELRDANAKLIELADRLSAAGPSSAKSPSSTSFVGTSGAWDVIHGNKLGQGGQGAVRRAWNENTKTLGALKTSETRRPDKEQARARFDREVSALRRLRHPNVLPLLDYGEDPRPFFVTPIAPFGTLADHGEALKTDTWRCLRLIRNVASGLDAAHRFEDLGLVHRDVKPQNIFLFSLDHAAIGDFGIVYDPEGESLTKTEERVGSRDFSPPEANSKTGPRPTPAFDVFSLGACLHALISGELVPPEHYWDWKTRPALDSAPLEEIVSLCLQPDPAQRPTMRTLITALDGLILKTRGGGDLHSCSTCGGQLRELGMLFAPAGGGLKVNIKNQPHRFGTPNFQVTSFECESCGTIHLRRLYDS